MSSDNESNDNIEDLSPTENTRGHVQDQAVLSPDEKIECLISLVQKYKFLYDQEQRRHKGKVANAWEEISQEIGETSSWCQRKWKNTKGYYYDLKSVKKGKGGQKRGKGITWPYYNMMSFLDGGKSSNHNTVSNLDFEVPAKVPRANVVLCKGIQGCKDHEKSAGSTRVEQYKDCRPKSSLTVKKRNLSYKDQVNVKMLEVLEKATQSLVSISEEPQDEISCWARLAECRLRQLHPSVATSVMMQCDQVIVGAMQASLCLGKLYEP